MTGTENRKKMGKKIKRKAERVKKRDESRERHIGR